MAKYNCTAGGNAVVDRIRYIMLENLKQQHIIPKINYARKVAFNARMILAVFKALFHPRRYEYNILLH